MTVAKVIEISSQSTQSFEDAVAQGIAKAGQSVRNIKSAWINQQQVVVEDNKIAQYRVDLKVTFVLE